MKTNLKIEINGKEVEASLEEWEKVSIKLQELFKTTKPIYIPYPTTPIQPIEPQYPGYPYPIITYYETIITGEA